MNLPVAKGYRPNGPVPPYPSHQLSSGIESFAADYFSSKPIEGWVYLPIRWTELAFLYQNQPLWKKKYLNATSRKVKALNNYYKSVVRFSNLRVFTIVQHACGLNFHKHINQSDDIFVFACGGNGDVPLPLLCDKRKAIQFNHNKYLVSFKGVISHPSNAYPFRECLKEEFSSPDCVIIDTCVDMREDDYIDLMASSEFSLCPRGYGPTSFRLYEAIEQGSIPVYIHDGNPWLPYQDEIDWNRLAVIVDYKNISGLYDMLVNMSQSQKTCMLEYAKSIQVRYFTKKGACDYVCRILSNAGGGSVRDLRKRYY